MGLPPFADGAGFYCTCERNRKRFRTQTVAAVDGRATWNEVISFTCTLVKKHSQLSFSKKDFVFKAKSAEKINFDGSLASISISSQVKNAKKKQRN